jgi:hypothetical protein
MQEILQYLLKWSIALGVAYIFYRLVLRPLTFYQWNRRYLVLYSTLAFFIPFINITTYVPQAKLQGMQITKYIPVINIAEETAAAPSNSIDFLLLIILLIATGSVVLFTRLLLQWYSLRRIRKTAVPVDYPGVNVYHVDEQVIPFSFGNSIYVNTSLHTEHELRDIILHEFVHVRQKHSLDIIWSEILCILNWYNPFAWLIRHAIRQNLEFIADQAVLNNGLDKKTYQYHLLKVIGSAQYCIANNFNFSSLKKRIAMMNRLRTARVHLVKFLFVLPLLAVLLVAFGNNKGWNKQVKNDTIPQADVLLPDEMVLHNLTVDDLPLLPLKAFYKRNPSVKQVAWSDEDELFVYLKNGRREVYDTEDKNDMQKFVKIYGGVPTILAPLLADIFEPLPPLAPDAPVVIDELELPDIEIPGVEMEIPNVEMDIPEVEIPYEPLEPALIEMDEDAGNELIEIQDDPPPPPAKPLAPDALQLPKGVKSALLNNNVLTLRLLNGAVERYDLTNPREKAAAEKKYGKIIKVVEPPKVVQVRDVRSVHAKPAQKVVLVAVSKGRRS